MKRICCLVILLCARISYAQTSLTALHAGDDFPNIYLNNIVRAPYTSCSLSSFKHKLVLIDFWATWCSSCVREFPKLDSLQRILKDSLQVFLVNDPGSGDDRQKTKAFFEKRKNASGQPYLLPVVINELKLALLFPHRSIPHIVWLYDGKVAAITGGDEVSGANIEAMLAGRAATIEQKEDVMDYRPELPLLQQGNGGDEAALLHRSLFTRYLRGMGSSTGMSRDDSAVKRLYIINQPLLKMYAIAHTDLAANRLVLENVDTGMLINEHKDERWERNCSFTYELTVPATCSLSRMHEIMCSDIDHQFGLYSRVEKRMIHCYALVRTDTVNTVFLAHGIKNTNGVEMQRPGRYALYNQPLQLLTDALNEQYSGTPLHPVVLNETKYTLPVDLDLAVTDVQDLPAMKTALQPYGLDLIAVTRELSVLVISGKGNSTTSVIY